MDVRAMEGTSTESRPSHPGQFDPADRRMQEEAASTESTRREDVFEWVPGGFFLVHHWEAAMGKRVLAGSDILVFDRDQTSSFSHFFEEFGSRLVCRKSIDCHAATSGQWPESKKVVARNPRDHVSLSVAWEWRIDEGDGLAQTGSMAR